MRLIGIDEAGLGPNLGPLVVVATVWDVPDATPESFWTTFAPVLCADVAQIADEPCDDNSPSRLHIADSKAVFQPQRGHAALARGVLSFLSLCGEPPTTWGGLLAAVGRPVHEQIGPELSTDWPLPQLAPSDKSIVDRWRALAERSKFRPKQVVAQVVGPQAFNTQLVQLDNKAAVTSTVHQEVLRTALAGDLETPTLVVSDKHGGRNRYAEYLQPLCEPHLVLCHQESATLSRYRAGNVDFRFEPRAESWGPVALASMVAKFTREMAMQQINAWWQTHVPGLKPTQGYPLDARRFWSDTAEARLRLGLCETTLWRAR